MAYIPVEIILCHALHEQAVLNWSQCIFMEWVTILKIYVISFFYLETLTQLHHDTTVYLHIRCTTIVYMYASQSRKLIKAIITWYMTLLYFSMCHIITRHDTSIWVRYWKNILSLLSNITHIEMVYAIRLSLYEYLTSDWITDIIGLQLLICMIYLMPKPRHCRKIVLSLRLYKHNCDCVNCRNSVSKCQFTTIVPDFWDWRIALPSIIRCLSRHLLSLKRYMLNHYENYCGKQRKVLGKLIHCHTIRLIYVFKVKHNFIVTLLWFWIGTLYYPCNNSTRLVFDLAQNSVMPTAGIRRLSTIE
ncbi:uncharacterized protein LOC125492540 [Beta vulgaris subsp. vulgaris]|uniref:uncharacterized protein LOC125492540 n=1 Tax=Beta vulgaris subsp. vulgaris TaxID=3555 RepID=UPI002547E1EE|nr:uncharacterized protein LOC125492540 [Beta vulgaris subsp. vulgaris]XP_048491106.2 uncharacterized protein LOC125492540 [Beta vulgaris subsp. vulgaris]